MQGASVEGLCDQWILSVNFEIHIVDSECSEAYQRQQLTIQAEEYGDEMTEIQGLKYYGHGDKHGRHDARKNQNLDVELYLPDSILVCLVWILFLPIHALDDYSREVGTMSKKFEYAEGWRRHSHRGYATSDSDPLAEVLGDKYLVNEDYEKSLG